MKQDSLIYIVDDDSAVRDGLQMLFESAGYRVSACADAETFLQHYTPDVPCCLILDLRMPVTGGLELQEILAGQELPPPVIFLSGHGTVSTAVRALKKGAFDFFQKPVTDEQQLLDRAAEAILQNLDSITRFNKHRDARKRMQRLTNREQEVMEQICRGKTNKVIGIDLGISERTVELHRAHLMKKLGVRTVADLVRLQDHSR